MNLTGGDLATVQIWVILGDAGSAVKDNQHLSALVSACMLWEYRDVVAKRVVLGLACSHIEHEED
jgi:hypothetical protein